MVKTSKLVWYAGIVGVVASGVLNALFLVETMHMVTIQVPTHTLEPYQTIDTQDVTTIQVPAKSLQADTITGNLIGKVTAMTIPQGDPVQNFEIAKQGSMAQVIQNLYVTHPTFAFAEISVQNAGLTQTIQPGQHVNLIANTITYPNVWVLSVSNASGQTASIGTQVSQAVSNFVGVNPSTNTPSSGTLTLLIGAPWPTVQALMNSTNTQVIMGNVGAASYSLGSPPVATTTTVTPVHASIPLIPGNPTIHRTHSSGVVHPAKDTKKGGVSHATK